MKWFLGIILGVINFIFIGYLLIVVIGIGLSGGNTGLLKELISLSQVSIPGFLFCFLIQCFFIM